MIDPNFDLLIIPLGFTYDDDGRVLGYRDASGFWYVYTRDDAGRVLTYRDSSGCRDDYTYDADGDGECTITYTQEAAT
jgi:YD repeat-containing protein